MPGSALANAGAFLVNDGIAFLLASILAWAAGRFLSIGGGLGTGGIALVALGLTVAFYWYERNRSSWIAFRNQSSRRAAGRGRWS